MSRPEHSERVAVIGAGKVGTAVATVLSLKGYPVVKVCDISESARGRAARVTGAEATGDPLEAARDAEIVLITTPDDSIGEVCRSIAESDLDIQGKKFIHMSGALPLEVLEPVSSRGAETLSVHPIQTFADLEGATRSLPGSTFGVTCHPEAESWARDFVGDLGGRVLMVDDRDRVLYHAAAVVASNLLVMIQHGAHDLYCHLGLDREEAMKAFLPLVRATVENIAGLGPAAALTGPLVRGDVGTIEAHIEVLEEHDPELAAVYRAVSLWGLRIVRERGTVEDGKIEKIARLIQVSEEGSKKSKE